MYNLFEEIQNIFTNMQMGYILNSCKINIILKYYSYIYSLSLKLVHSIRLSQLISTYHVFVQKAEYVKGKEYGGVMVFSLNTDDFNGVCDGKQTFPLTRRIKNVMQDDQL